MFLTDDGSDFIRKTTEMNPAARTQRASTTAAGPVRLPLSSEIGEAPACDMFVASVSKSAWRAGGEQTRG
jgi:hypothetical protein